MYFMIGLIQDNFDRGYILEKDLNGCLLVLDYVVRSFKIDNKILLLVDIRFIFLKLFLIFFISVLKIGIEVIVDWCKNCLCQYI